MMSRNVRLALAVLVWAACALMASGEEDRSISVRCKKPLPGAKGYQFVWGKLAAGGYTEASEIVADCVYTIPDLDCAVYQVSVSAVRQAPIVGEPPLLSIPAPPITGFPTKDAPGPGLARVSCFSPPVAVQASVASTADRCRGVTGLFRRLIRLCRPGRR